MRLNSGPPRLRIDNVINGRVDSCAVIEDDIETDEKCDEPESSTREEGFMMRGAHTLQLGDSNRENRNESEVIEGKRRAATPDEIWAESGLKRVERTDD
jgi:hypothetical protein